MMAALSTVVGAGQVDAQNTLGAPTPGTITAGANALTLPWTAPSDNGGSTITAYDLRYIPTADDETVDANWTATEDVWVTGGGALSHTIGDLEDGVQFDVQVRAENANGDVGPWSTTSTGTTTDHGGTTAAATDLALGSSLAGRLSPATDEDVFEITLANDGEIWIYATGQLDTVGELLNSGGAVLEEHDDGTHLDGPQGFEFRETLDAGTYYVRVSSYEDRQAGSYRIHAHTFTDPGSTFATATTVTLDSATPGRIGPRGGLPTADPAGDADYFKLVLTAATDVWVMAYGRMDVGDEVLDTEGILYDASENQLQRADDSEFVGNELGFMLRRSLAVGTYYIRVNGFDPQDVGPYTLHVRTAAEPGSTTATAAPLTLRVPETGRITSSTDRDYFSLTLADDTYVFIYALTFGRALSLTPTVLDSQGSVVSMHVIPHANWKEQGLAEFSFSVWGKLTAGTYHIRVAGSSGSYLLDPLVSSYNRMLEDCTAITTPQSDPWYGCQWHLNNTGQFTGGAAEDINVESVWTGGNRGSGINIAVVDDGLDDDHVDLADNVIASRNHDYTGQGGVYDPLETHGTAVAGLIAARDNAIGVRGVAPRASIFAYSLIAQGSSISAHEASAMYKSEDAQVTAISNHSWGSVPTGLPISAASTWERAVTRGVTEGYGGKGILYVLSGGNGHEDSNNNSNLDGRANYYAVIAVCAVGYDDRRSSYSELGANLWLCAPSDSGREDLPAITTTHIPDRYRDNFGGTSAAAPIVSGTAALVRAANTNLTWRDVKLILAASARQNDPTDGGWEDGALKYGSTNDRYSFNHEYGFGMVDAASAVTLADGWTNVPTMRTWEASSGQLGAPGFPGLFLPDYDGTTATPVSTTLSLDAYVQFIEFVEIEIEFRHEYFRDLRIELESPNGKTSTLSVPALAPGQERFIGSHRFGSAKHLGENAEGIWTLTLTDEQSADVGRLISWRLKVYGHGKNPGHVVVNTPVAGGGALTVTWDAPAEVGSSAVASYDLRYILADAPDTSAANWTVVNGAGSLTDRTHTVTGLEGEERYRIAVRAVNSDGNGPWVQGAVTETLAVKPGQPRSVSVVARNEALAVSWREPSFRGAGIEAYDIWHIRDDATDKGDAFWTKAPDAWRAGSGEPRYVIRGLDNGVTYQVQVRATNSRADGDWAAVVKRAPADVNGPAEFPNTETGRRSIPENTAAGTNIGDPIAARDDESDTLTYSLTSGAANFDIVSTTGQLQTRAALDHERTPSYAVTVAVHDGKAADGSASTANDDTLRVSITVEDVDEPPAVTGRETPMVRENTTAVATYRASDPEGASTMFTWSLAGDDAGAFAISEAGVLTFDPAPDFEAPTDAGADNTYEVTVRATDDAATDPAAMTGGLDVQVTVQDIDEPPEIGGDASYTIAENSSTRVGSYAATDPEGTDTTWLSLAGTDARHFTLDEFGVLSFTETPDFDRATNGNHGPEYRVTLRASDEGNRVGALPVTVTLTGVNEGPLIEGDAVVDVNEGHAGTLDTYTKRDPEGSATNWGAVGSSMALSGANADAFDFNQSTGRLTFISAPDFEDGGGSYLVTLTANDGVLAGTLDVTVNVANLDERGAVVLSGRRGVINVALRATLTDPDNVVSETWEWQRSTSRTSGWTAIANTDASSYTPTADDRNRYLRATVSYEDGHGAGKGANAATEFTTVNERGTNTPPVLPDSVDAIAIAENTLAGRNVGSPVRATDGENDPLIYTLSGASQFTIGRTTGQIRVADGVTLDYEGGQRSYSLTVGADDGFGGTDSVAVTVDIEDVNEAPTAAGDAPSVAEDGTIDIDVLANDSDPENGTLSLASALPARPRWGTATVDTATNRITYTPRANYHGADSFRYRIQDDGSPRLSSTATVSITVSPVNDDPEFASATAERRVAESAEEGDAVGAPLTATDVDEGDALSYRLSGTDGFSFDIDDSGQITVASGVTFDAGTRDTYEVTVEADDGNGGRASIDVTITITTRSPPPPVIFAPIGIGGGGGPTGPTPSEEDFEWTVEHDIDALDEDNAAPTGAWSNGATLWLADNPNGAGDAVYAYDLADGERFEEQEFELDETNRAPRGTWSDRETIWVSDSGQERLFAYNLGTGARIEDRDMELARRNDDPRGIWSDGETMWVLDDRRNALFAYDLESGEFLAEYALDPANDPPHGIWSDGTTVWISNHDPKRLFAYRLPVPAEHQGEEDLELERTADLDFAGLSKAGNNSPRGIWSDGEVMYVADANDGKVYSYNMPDAIDARLASLVLEGIDIGEFSPGQPEYEGVPRDLVTSTTVDAEAAQPDATVAIAPDDADDDATSGHQVALAGLAAITVTVTSADGSRSRDYTVRFAEAESWPHCMRGDVAVGFSLVVYEGGSVEDLAACAQSRGVDALYALSNGAYASFILGAPGVVNQAFRELYPGGVPPLTALVAASDGPPSDDPVGDIAVPSSWPDCLHGGIAAGFNLVLYAGGSVADLEACAERLHVTALYVLADGQWISYILGAPDFVNQAFRDLYADGLPAVTPLIARAGDSS